MGPRNPKWKTTPEEAAVGEEVVAVEQGRPSLTSTCLNSDSSGVTESASAPEFAAAATAGSAPAPVEDGVGDGGCGGDVGGERPSLHWRTEAEQIL